ncbi:hypothetical protein JXA40_01130 [bacterium]|nr:hypothetical protein [candidate division CSSED10-310 bacterium]
MRYKGEDLRLTDGGLGHEIEIPCYDESPTWLVDRAWDEVQTVAENALSAYMKFCRQENYRHSYLLGLDILFMGKIDPGNPRRLIDIRPTLVEGPCCNSYPACPAVDAYKLYRRLQVKQFDPDRIEYPTHPTMVRQKIANLLTGLHRMNGGNGLPRVAVFTRPYPESEEETAHVLMLNAFRRAGMEAYRITPDEKPEVKKGRLWIHGNPLDIVYRRIERIHVPVFYGDKLAHQIIHETPATIFVNPWEIDDLRSKTIEERCFRLWEAEHPDKPVSRPVTLLNEEVTPENVLKLAQYGGWVMKKWNSTGGKGVFLHFNDPVTAEAVKHLYLKADGRHMVHLDASEMQKELAGFESFNEDTAIQQLRLIDARVLDSDRRLVYDTRINVLFNPEMGWEFISGMSRSVSCGPGLQNGNSLLTNITSGAEISPLIMGYSRTPELTEGLNFGPILSAIMNGKTEMTFD